MDQLKKHTDLLSTLRMSSMPKNTMQKKERMSSEKPCSSIWPTKNSLKSTSPSRLTKNYPPKESLSHWTWMLKALIGPPKVPSQPSRTKDNADHAGHSEQPECWKVSSSSRMVNSPTSLNNNWLTAPPGLTLTSDATEVCHQELLTMSRETVSPPKMLIPTPPSKELVPSKEVLTKPADTSPLMLLKKLWSLPSKINPYQSELTPPIGNIMTPPLKRSSQIVNLPWTTPS